MMKQIPGHPLILRFLVSTIHNSTNIPPKYHIGRKKIKWKESLAFYIKNWRNIWTQTGGEMSGKQFFVKAIFQSTVIN